MAVLTLWPLLLPFAAFSGWWYGVRQHAHRDKERSTLFTRDYFIGLNYLINEQHDKALDAFLKLLDVDSDTAETHLALGSLFRRRGEVDRAIRIHQNLIARPKLSEEQRIEALLGLGRDYMSAGVLDRAEHLFTEVMSLQGEVGQTALRHLLDIYQQEKKWSRAIEIAEHLQSTTTEDMAHVIAHHYCELAEEMLEAKDFTKASKYINRAMQINKNAVRASFLLARMARSQKEYKTAIKYFQRVATQSPDFISITIEPLVDCHRNVNDEEGLIAYLHETLEKYPRMTIVTVLAESIRKNKGMEQGVAYFAEQLRLNPSLRGLNTLIGWHLATTEGRVRDQLQVLQDLMARLLENLPIYRCINCGFSGKKLHWHCPSCKRWETVRPIQGLEGD